MGQNPIDVEIFAELISLQQATHPTLIQELVDLFVSTSLESLEKMDVLLRKGDMAELSEVAHGMKSSAANLGAVEVSRLCLTLEQLGNLQAPTPEVHRLVAHIKASYVIAERALRLQTKLAA